MGEHVKAKRLEAGLHQAELAAQLEVDEFTVLNWENGHTMPRVSYYSRIVTFLGYDPIGEGETLPEKMKAYRRREGFDQREAGQRIGVDEGTWRAWETGRRVPNSINEVRLHRLFQPDIHPEPPGGSSFGANVRQWRIEAGLSQRRLAKLLGVHATTIRAWELGHRLPPDSRRREVAVLLEQDPGGPAR
ncbi:MAG: helix-turn-helix domain-containing protein [bacterium]|nr:helix-turn-helix domain-containing protein [bacterium]